MRQDRVKIEVEDEDEDKISYYNDVPDLKIQFNQEELDSLREVFDEFSERCEEPDGKINFTFLFQKMEDRLLEENQIESNEKLVYEILRRVPNLPEFQAKETRIDFDFFVEALKKSM